MKKVNLLAIAIMLLGLSFANYANANANSYSPVGNENTISTQIDFDGGIVDPDDDDEENTEKG